ncbi:methylated-DNA--[protein]-cysteine S-methyltransferase [Brassicibacter mesophilus]|jgi:methylated-DNA-[protein]-cysteine S-methyltransferase|uniref:methylated-DNA--[protein]-cysteine S-methyltransferase n=1 Tax=Brassicibacter mesophilus TaxID=745119 RepID=UPI003D1BC515
MRVYYHSFSTDIGDVMVAFSNKGIVNLSFLTNEKMEYPRYLSKFYDDIIEHNGDETNYSEQIKLFLTGRLKKIDVSLDLHGTEFQMSVWNELLKIPYGEVRSYKDIAEAIGRDKAYRAVGMANNRNPIPIIIPCHRVVGNNGDLVGYGGGIDIKIKLLELEGIKIFQNKIVRA